MIWVLCQKDYNFCIAIGDRYIEYEYFKSFNSKGFSMDKILTVACSTYGDRISNILKVYESIDAVKKINFLVIHQVPEGTCLSDESNSVILRLESHPSIDYIKNSSKGLTLSRNIAIRKTKTQYMWVMDDDLEFISGAINKVLKSLEDENINVICHTYESLRPVSYTHLRAHET